MIEGALVLHTLTGEYTAALHTLLIRAVMMWKGPKA